MGGPTLSEHRDRRGSDPASRCLPADSRWASFTIVEQILEVMVGPVSDELLPREEEEAQEIDE